MENAELIELPVDEIIPYENNPRHNEQAVEAVAESIRQCGYVAPIIVDENNVILAGHTRLQAVKRLGYDTVPVMVRTGLTAAQKRKYRILDNKTAEYAEWDLSKLEIELEGLDFDGFDFGFDIDDSEPQEVVEDDYDPEPPAEPKAKRGDIYQLGRHRLMCGDSTSEEDVRKLMGGGQADIAITSPPYGAKDSARIREHYVPGAKTQESFYNEYADSISEWSGLINGAFQNMANNSKCQFVNIQMLADNKRQLVEFLYKNRSRLVDVIVWDKEKAAPQMQEKVLNNQFEFVFIFGEPNGSRTVPFSSFHGTVNNVIKLPTGNNEFADIHRAVFPVAFPTRLMEIASNAESVLDVFGGTGTTLIAAEQLGRVCYMMELDPRYIDVIIDRWEKLTGEKAVLISE